MESSRTSETIYQPLPSPSSIRVLRLLPGPRGTRICCKLETIELGPEQDVELYHDEPLEDTGPSSHVEVILGLGLQYEALSYVWGDASVTTIIEVEVDIEMRRVKGTLRGLDPALLRVKGHRDLTDPTLTLAGSDH
jgi:hypothetical protein